MRTLGKGGERGMQQSQVTEGIQAERAGASHTPVLIKRGRGNQVQRSQGSYCCEIQTFLFMQSWFFGPSEYMQISTGHVSVDHLKVVHLQILHFLKWIQPTADRKYAEEQFQEDPKSKT